MIKDCRKEEKWLLEPFLLFSTIFPLHLYLQESIYILICVIWLFYCILPSILQNRICRCISKYFRKVLGLRGNESRRLYVGVFTKVLTSTVNVQLWRFKFSIAGIWSCFVLFVVVLLGLVYLVYQCDQLVGDKWASWFDFFFFSFFFFFFFCLWLVHCLHFFLLFWWDYDLGLWLNFFDRFQTFYRFRKKSI